MPPLEHATLLMQKARQDEYAVRKLIPDRSAPDEIIGFHAQQAVEKMLKAVLVARQVSLRRTHDLVELLDLLRDNGVTYPAEMDEVRRLNPFAVAFRYDEVPDEPERHLERAWVLECVSGVRAWCESLLSGGKDL